LDYEKCRILRERRGYAPDAGRLFGRFGAILNAQLKTALSGFQSFVLEADCTRSTQDVRSPWTKHSGDSQNRMTIRCAQWNASRAADWRRRRVAVARPVRIDQTRAISRRRAIARRRRRAV